MTVPPPARVGMKIEDVDTPALLIDLDAFEHNLKHMAGLVKGFGVNLRPHAKTHKSPVIALKQMAHGAVGQCCQKVGEAEVLAAGGVPDILVSNQIVGASKIARLAALSKHARISVCADDRSNVADLDEAAEAFGTRLEVLVEVDLGMGRCGVEPGKAAVELAKIIDTEPNLDFGGLQVYHGRAQHIRGFGERRQTIVKAGEQVADTVEQLKRAGLACRLITGAGTGTFQFEASSGIWNELQAGSYVFMDADYARNLTEDGEFVDTFRHSLFVYATVMSRTARDRAIVDAGHKAAAIDSGLPTVYGIPDATYAGASDEHGKIVTGPGAAQLRLGDKIRLIPGHCDPTVNLHDWYVGVRGDTVEAVWPVAARGAAF
jgi:3-hydroxy-D-aspartate aldolase